MYLTLKIDCVHPGIVGRLDHGSKQRLELILFFFGAYSFTQINVLSDAERWMD